MTDLYRGSCFCGAVEIEVTGEPSEMGFCHCLSCRSWSGSPVHAMSIWDAGAVRVVGGVDNLASFQKSPESISHRQFCRTCGGQLMISHPSFDAFDVFPATLPTLVFRPTLHIHYVETVLPLKDGLPKFRDTPLVWGGSGALVPE